VGVDVTQELIGFFFVQQRLHTSIYLFRDENVGGLRVRVDGAGRHFALLCHSLSLFESQLDHCVSPFPALIQCRSITARAIYTTLSELDFGHVVIAQRQQMPSADT
jgi:hypothetical protein